MWAAPGAREASGVEPGQAVLLPGVAASEEPSLRPEPELEAQERELAGAAGLEAQPGAPLQLALGRLVVVPASAETRRLEERPRAPGA